MSKYDKMIELNQKNSTEKIERAQKAIYEMMQEEEKVTIPKLMKKTGLSRGFFYKNPAVRKEVDRAIEQQAGLVDKRRKIIDMAMENRIVLLEQSVAKLKKENEDLKKQNEKLKGALNKRDLNMLRKL
ncbi:DUF6262 family protein [Robinsoniella peoriensis]